MSVAIGSNAMSVLELMRERRRSHYVPGMDPSRKLALIVEGGGMRGVLSAGSLLAFDLMGFRHCFDSVYAASAGGVNAAYFISGQGRLGITVYFDSISNRRFINPLRLNKIVDVDYVYDEVVPHHKPLDEAAVRRSPTRFFLSATDVDTGRNVLIDVQRSRDSVARILKASSALPILYNRVVQLESGHYVDGGATDALPLLQAVAAKHTDVLVLTTKVSHHVSTRPTLAQAAFAYTIFGWKYPELLRECLRAYERANHNRRIAVGDEVVPGVNVATLCPEPANIIVGRTTTRRDKLVSGAHLMARAACRAMQEDVHLIDSVFTEFEPRPVIDSASAG